ncbi:MAG: tetratricopeptide repeat protein [Pseudomonadota bacterium]
MKRRLALVAPLLLVALGCASVDGNPHLDRCLKAEGGSTTLADRCRRALDWGGLSARQQAAAWTNIGVANTELGRDGDALEALDRAVAADPAFASARINRALARARRGQTEGALEDWSEAIDLRPKDPEPRAGRASLLLQSGEPEAALDDLDAALALDPESPDIHFNRGVALAELGRRDDAAQAFGRVIEFAPDDASAHLRRGLLFAEDDPERALRDLDAAIERAPRWAAAWATRGRLRERLGMREGAGDDYRRAFELGHQASWLNEKIEALGG